MGDLVDMEAICNGNGQAYLGLSEHVDKPTAHSTVRTARDQVVRVLGAHHLHCVHRVRVSGSGERCLKNR